MSPKNQKLKTAVLEILRSPEAAEIVQNSAAASRLKVYLTSPSAAARVLVGEVSATNLLTHFFVSTLERIGETL